MATHSSVLAWRIPGMGEPGGLPSMGSHRVGHDWGDLAAAAAYLSQNKWSINVTLFFCCYHSIVYNSLHLLANKVVLVFVKILFPHFPLVTACWLFPLQAQPCLRLQTQSNPWKRDCEEDHFISPVFFLHLELSFWYSWILKNQLSWEKHTWAAQSEEWNFPQVEMLAR